MGRKGSSKRHAAPCQQTAPTLSGKLRRTEVAQRLGVSLTTLRRMEGTRLHPATGPDGVHLFDEAEVEAAVVTYRGIRARSAASLKPSDGEIAAAVFELFDGGTSLVEVVKQLQVAPDRVGALHRAWASLRQGNLASPSSPLTTAEGELAAAAFRLFAERKTPNEVVVALGQSPATIRGLHEDFNALATAAGELLLPSAAVKELEELLPGSPTTADELVASARLLHERTQRLAFLNAEARGELERARRGRLEPSGAASTLSGRVSIP
jgi:hypothetical protein